MTQTASTKKFSYSGAAYVKFGAYEQGKGMSATSDRFTALGGESFKVRPNVDFTVTVAVSGTAEAIAYVESICRANENAA